MTTRPATLAIGLISETRRIISDARRLETDATRLITAAGHVITDARRLIIDESRPITVVSRAITGSPRFESDCGRDVSDTSPPRSCPWWPICRAGHLDREAGTAMLMSCMLLSVSSFVQVWPGAGGAAVAPLFAGAPASGACDAAG